MAESEHTHSILDRTFTQKSNFNYALSEISPNVNNAANAKIPIVYERKGAKSHYHVPHSDEDQQDFSTPTTTPVPLNKSPPKFLKRKRCYEDFKEEKFDSMPFSFPFQLPDNATRSKKDDFRIDNQVFKPVLHQSECSSFLSMPTDNEDLSLPSFPLTLKNAQRKSQNQTRLADAPIMQRPTPRYARRGPDHVETYLRPRLNINGYFQPSTLTLGNELFSAFEQISFDSNRRG